MIEDLTNAMETQDFDLYKKHWDPEAIKLLTKEKFLEACKMTDTQLGKVVSKTFYNIKEKDGYIVVHWKAQMSKIPQGDLYLRLVLKKSGDTYLVEGHFIKPDANI